MEVIFILTYDCNFRCTYCDIDKRKYNMSKNNILHSIDFLKKNNIKFNKVKFFGGEPLLMKEDIVFIVDEISKFSESNFYVTSNSTLVDYKFIEFAKKNNLHITFSIDGSIDTTNHNRKTINGNLMANIIEKNTIKFSGDIRVNQVITTDNSNIFFENFKYIYNLGVRKFNFLPAYYKHWTKNGLKKLNEGFNKILLFSKNNIFELINIENFSETSFFNLGLVIDVDGNIYGTNLILSGKFEKYKKNLLIGNIYTGLNYNLEDPIFCKNYILKINSFLKKEYSADILKSVYYVDRILNNFCFKYKNIKK